MTDSDSDTTSVIFSAAQAGTSPSPNYSNLSLIFRRPLYLFLVATLYLPLLSTEFIFT